VTPVEHHSIDWSTVVVSPSPSGFQLTLPLDGELSVDWQRYFDDMTAQDALRPQQRRWGIVRLSEQAVVMEGLDAGSRSEARAYLDALVRKTNDFVLAKHEQLEQERIELELQEIELERTAGELTEWFRSTAPKARAPGQPARDAAGEEEVVEPPEPARPLELPDLRSRFGPSVDADQASPA
jgi:hypothetical protein